MQAYYSSSVNIFTIRTKQTGSQDLTLYLQDMYLLTNQSSSLTYDWNDEQQILQFTASIDNARVGGEYRAWIKDGCDNQLWDGSIQVYASQSIDKPEYKTQANDGYKSNLSTNEYIIME